MNRHESKDSCCRLLVTFKVKESTIYFKGYRISSLLDQGGYSKKLFTLIGRRAQEGGTPMLGLSCSFQNLPLPVSCQPRNFSTLIAPGAPEHAWAMLTVTSQGSEM